MSRFARSCTTTEKASFTLHLENFSELLCKGFYTSPLFESKPSGSKWSLIVYANDVTDYGSFIHVRLKRDEYATDMQTVEVKTSVIDCFGWSVLSKTKEITFSGFQDAQVLSVAKELVARNFGLNRLRFLPKDTLTLQCEFAIHECTVLDFDTEKDFKNNLEESTGVSLEYFVHSGLISERFDFVRRIDKFSVHTCTGRYVCPSYQRDPSDSKWTLVVYVDDNDYGGDFLDIRLKCGEIKEPHLVKVKLSIVDRSDKVLLSNEKDVYFPDAQKEARVFNVAPKSMPTWFGWNKKRLIPDDCLEMHCEVVIYEEIFKVFDDQKDFDCSLKTEDGYKMKQLLPFLLAVYMLLLVLILGGIAVYYAVWHIIIPFILSTIKYVAHVIIGVLVVLGTALYLLFRIRKDGEHVMRKAERCKNTESKGDCFKQKRKFDFNKNNGNGYYMQPSYRKRHY